MGRRLARGIRIAVGVVVIPIGLGAALVYGVSEARVRHRYHITPEPLVIPSDSASIARGRHLAQARLGCTACHAANLGGGTVMDNRMFGRFVAPNLTRGAGGIGSTYGDADWIRSVRHGVAPNGRPLVFMPSTDFAKLGRQDLADVIAYVRQVPPVDHEAGTSALGPIARILATLQRGMIPARAIDHSAAAGTVPAPGISTAYGDYLVSTGGCRGCHSAQLSGGGSNGPPGAPRPPNLTPAGYLGQWTEAEFIRTLRTGRRPDGRILDDEMPWKSMGKMTDVELRAIYTYLHSLAPQKTGSG